MIFASSTRVLCVQVYPATEFLSQSMSPLTPARLLRPYKDALEHVVQLRVLFPEAVALHEKIF